MAGSSLFKPTMVTPSPCSLQESGLEIPVSASLDWHRGGQRPNTAQSDGEEGLLAHKCREGLLSLWMGTGSIHGTEQPFYGSEGRGASTPLAEERDMKKSGPCWPRITQPWTSPVIIWIIYWILSWVFCQLQLEAFHLVKWSKKLITYYLLNGNFLLGIIFFLNLFLVI